MDLKFKYRNYLDSVNQNLYKILLKILKFNKQL